MIPVLLTAAGTLALFAALGAVIVRQQRIALRELLARHAAAARAPLVVQGFEFDRAALLHGYAAREDRPGAERLLDPRRAFTDAWALLDGAEHIVFAPSGITDRESRVEAPGRCVNRFSCAQCGAAYVGEELAVVRHPSVVPTGGGSLGGTIRYRALCPRGHAVLPDAVVKLG